MGVVGRGGEKRRSVREKGGYSTDDLVARGWIQVGTAENCARGGGGRRRSPH